MISRDDERPRREDADGFGDAVTFSWGDGDREVFGSARLGLSSAGGSALALLFAGAQPVAIDMAGGMAVPGDGDGRLSIGDVEATVEEPLGAWRVTFDGDAGGFDLRFEALTPPFEMGDDPAARAAALRGYEQVCRVRGTARTPQGEVEVDCLGQRGHQWGAPDWHRLELSRTLSAWLPEGHGVALTTVRPAGADAHDAEAVSAWIIGAGEEGGAEARPATDPRLSTIYDAEGRQRRAGVELWPAPDAEYPLRAAGELVCGTTLELGRLRLDAAFFRWHMGGQSGIGRYDVLRRRP